MATTMNVEEKVFQLPIDVEASGIVSKTLATADTYVDKNIKVTVTTPDAEFEVKDKGEGANGAITATVSTTDTTYTSETETPYAITIAADAHVDSTTVGVKTAGFAAATDEVVVESGDAEQATKTIYVKEGQLSGTGSAGAESSTVKLTKASADAEGFVIKASGAGNVGVATAGWVDPEHTTSVTTDGDAYYTVQKASFANTGSADAEELAAPILTSGGYLYINEGYVKDSKISLATLIPDDATIAETAEGQSEFMYNTISAYDKDGKLIAGSMGDAELGEITADDADATITSVTVAADGAGFKVTGTADISGNASVAVSKRGLATTALTQTGVIEGEATVDASLAKIGLAVDADESDIKVTPVIAKEDSTTAKAGAITDAQPTGRYVAVSTAAIAASATVNPTVATEGYGTTDVFDATGATVTAGANASGTYYVPIEAGSHAIEAGESTVVKATATVATTTEATDGFEGNLVAGILTAAPSTGEYITISADATPVAGSVKNTVTCTATEGYVEAGSQTASVDETVEVEVTAAAAKYIKVYDGSILD